MSTDSGSEDEELRTAIAMSLAGQSPGAGTRPSIATPHVNAQAKIGIAGLTGFDRKAMEQERLARLHKRQRSVSPPRSGRKAPKVQETCIDLPSGARLNTFSTRVGQDQAGRKTDAANAANEKLRRIGAAEMPYDQSESSTSTSELGALVYPHGVVRKTWAFRHVRDGMDIKIEEVLEPATLRTAVLSAFQWDAEWVLSKLQTPDKGGCTKCVFVMQAKEQGLREKMLEDTKAARSFLRLCFPPMIGLINCMHSKLMLLFHTNKLRVAIPTANLLNFDWGETGVMENSVFLIDLPRLANRGVTTPGELTFFGRELLFFLEQQGLDDDIKAGILNFDFSATSGMAFVHTVGGVSYKSACERTGVCGLGRTVRELGLQTHHLEVDFAASSIGSLNDAYLKTVHAAAAGDDMMSRATSEEARSKADFFKSVSAKTKIQPQLKNIREVFRVYFPTHETVAASTAGAAGTICISRKYWESDKFPASCFRDYRSARHGLLSHNKIFYARGKQKEGADGTVKDVAWTYVGSANMSESAWGKLVYDKKGKEWKINCRNWECGVLLPVSAAKLAFHGSANKANAHEDAVREESETESETSETESEDEAKDRDDVRDRNEVRNDSVVGMEVFTGLLDPPFEFPGQAYGDREPWFFME